MKIQYLLVVVILILTIGCASVPQIYRLSVFDVEGNPVDSVQIDYSVKLINNSSGTKKDTTDTTTIDGVFTHKVYVDPYLGSSMFSYSISKNGYYPKSGNMFLISTSTSDSIKSESITLIRPIDYLDETFVSSKVNSEIKTRILNFLDFIIMEAALSESVLEPRSINLSNYKGQDYLQFRFTSANVYNSLQLDKYDIGKRLFDDIIRKIMSPLNTYISGSGMFSGYDLVVIGSTKSFIDDYAVPEEIEYRFIIPISVVKQYKNKDITGQAVLDSSIIIMDNERIELQLQ